MHAFSLPSQKLLNWVGRERVSSWLVCAGKQAGQHTFIRLHSAPVTQLMIVTSVPEKGCPLEQGDRATLLGIMNKQDYARWHSYQFYLSTRTVDPTIRPEGALDVCGPFCV